MFQTHFIVFHALYLVRDRWHQREVGELDIHTLKIVLRPPAPTSRYPTQSDTLRDYYLNWNNFSETSENDVEALLDDFWKQMGSHRGAHAPSETELEQARQTLELDPHATLNLKQVKRQYRKLVHRHHPDKGGSDTKARQLVHAYGVLSTTLRA